MEDNPKLLLRQTTTQDYRQIEWLTREAFWNVHVPGCDEHYLAHVLRDSPDYLFELDYVAVWDGSIVGNIMYARSEIRSKQGGCQKVLTFGLVSVLPTQQNRGIGKALINHTMNLASQQGHKLLVIYGDPDYYCRFGFVPGESFDIRTSDGLFSPALQVKELVPGALTGLNGTFHETGAYHLDPLAAAKFERGFEPKEKQETPSQKRFRELLALSHS